MKKLDKLIIKAFLGPFVLTFLVVVFILLMQYLLKYFDEIIGKGLGPLVYAELLFFFSVTMTTLALPLAVLLSSLMTFGNLGEHFELTAIKSSGISLVRTLLPIFVFTLFLTAFAFYNNDRIVPKVNLKAYSLLYDIRQTKPSLSLKEGSFYNGIPNYSIKVTKKYPDDVSLKGVIIYDHTKGKGNTDVILADSGRMYSFGNDKYLMLEMYKGYSYSEPKADQPGSFANNKPAEFMRNEFHSTKLIFSLESFGMNSTPQEYFASNKIMKNIGQLRFDIDSMENKIVEARYAIYQNARTYNPYVNNTKVPFPAGLEQQYKVVDSLNRERLRALEAQRDSLPPSAGYAGISPTEQLLPPSQLSALESNGTQQIEDYSKRRVVKETVYAYSLADTALLRKSEAQFAKKQPMLDVYRSAVGQVRYVKNNYEVYGGRANDLQRQIFQWHIEIHKKWAQAVACLVMFLIGAPLGAIIKRGGLGVPVIVSIAFFIIYYVLTMFGEKWAREGIVSPELGIWSANLILLPFGLFFLRQARNDARLFESDFYNVMIAKFRSAIGEKVRRPEVLSKAFGWRRR
ncbi:LptF/LptG family permease [Cesiribacter andamanensis]|uniref:Lipopolysaccharide ABC transporter permease LptF n=1 Tax=Cesiribacter andamanensis AMV16 TaxID=1279009 RepID=M7NBA7_9BACT|nr:LptF/LptG family permease [Cesiribacter andamanensis]EMR04486.1 lipopolysaccharide ABC transporter permease LptF [Cesiribacter andamanensis AMV16]